MLGLASTTRGIALERRLLRGIDALALRLGRRPANMPPHLATGLRGEEEALFHLRKLGYVIVARRWKTPKILGDVDLIGWDGDTLCFIEVKTRTGRDIVPAEFAVDQKKQKMLRSMASVYRKRFPEPQRSLILIRFDVVSVYLPATGADPQSKPEIEVFPAAFHR
jgi:putative endonuclease